jgi:hypothetical protein
MRILVQAGSPRPFVWPFAITPTAMILRLHRDFWRIGCGETGAQASNLGNLSGRTYMLPAAASPRPSAGPTRIAKRRVPPPA